MAGPTVVALLLALQIRTADDPSRLARWLLAAGLLGSATDSLLALAGLFSFLPGPLSAWISPPWLLFLWMAFGSTLPRSLAWLGDSPRLAAGLGAAGGPLSYYAGAELGAVRLTEPAGTSLLVLACVWAILLPGLFTLMRRLGVSPKIRT